MRAARVMDLDAVDRPIGKLGGDFAGKVVIIASTPRRDKPTSASRPLLERNATNRWFITSQSTPSTIGKAVGQDLRTNAKTRDLDRTGERCWLLLASFQLLRL